MAYNGWTNYETWNCNLHHDDLFTEDAERLVEEKLSDITDNQDDFYREDYEPDTQDDDETDEEYKQRIAEEEIDHENEQDRQEKEHAETMEQEKRDGLDKHELTLALAEYIENFVEENMPEVSGFYDDILSAAIREVNFYEIASHYIDDAIENCLKEA